MLNETLATVPAPSLFSELFYSVLCLVIPIPTGLGALPGGDNGRP